MINFIALAAGIIVAVVIIFQFNQLESTKIKWIYPLILATLPAYYWIFAIYVVNYDALLKEVLFGTLFIAAALLSFRFSSSFGRLALGAGFVIHALYDIAHVKLSGYSIAPIWWPEFCGAVDMILGFYLLWIHFANYRLS